MAKGSLFDHPPLAGAAEELFTPLLTRPGCRLERIASHGHASPPDFWYDQAEGEWVLLVSGAACLRLEGPDERVELAPGEFLYIAPHRRHRVEWTAEGQATLWLALFLPARDVHSGMGGT